MTPDEQAMLRALALQVRMLHTDIQDVRERLSAIEGLVEMAITNGAELYEFIDAINESSRIPNSKKH